MWCLFILCGYDVSLLLFVCVMSKCHEIFLSKEGEYKSDLKPLCVDDDLHIEITVMDINRGVQYLP